MGLGELKLASDFIGDELLDPSVLQTFTWRVPTVMRFDPTQAIWEMLVVHLLLAYSVAEPFRLLMAQMYRNPSFAAPRLARY
jgi:hypothetical protein